MAHLPLLSQASGPNTQRKVAADMALGGTERIRLQKTWCRREFLLNRQSPSRTRGPVPRGPGCSRGHHSPSDHLEAPSRAYRRRSCRGERRAPSACTRTWARLRATEGRSRSDAWCTGTEEEELRCEAAEIGEGVTALAVLSRVSSLAQCEADPDIAQCEADSLEGRGTTPCERRLVHWHRGRGAPLRSSRDRGRRHRPRRPQSSVQPRAERSRSRHRAMRSR